MSRLWKEYRVRIADGYVTTFAVNRLGVGTMSCSKLSRSAEAQAEEIRRSIPYADIKVKP